MKDQDTVFKVIALGMFVGWLACVIAGLWSTYVILHALCKLLMGLWGHV